MARRKPFALVVLALLAAAGCSQPAPETAKPAGAAFPVGLVFDIGGRGDKSFNDAAFAGLTRAQQELGIRFTTLETSEGSDREAQLRQLASGDSKLIFGVGFLFTDDVRNLAKEFPDKKFACIDYTVTPNDTLPPNLVALKFRENEGSFLVGALAAWLSKTHKVGFVGGMEIPLIRKFQAGYVAGAKAADPKVDVLVKYAGTTGAAFKDPTKGKELGLAEYHAGADIIFHASGSTGLGVFEAARELKKLAIGVDSDQYLTADPKVKDVIMTSMLKKVDVAVYDFITQVNDDKFTAGTTTYDLAKDGVGYATSGGQVDDIKTQLEDAKAKIISGEIKVPTK